MGWQPAVQWKADGHFVRQCRQQVMSGPCAYRRRKIQDRLQERNSTWTETSHTRRPSLHRSTGPTPNRPSWRPMTGSRVQQQVFGRARRHRLRSRHSIPTGLYVQMPFRPDTPQPPSHLRTIPVRLLVHVRRLRTDLQIEQVCPTIALISIKCYNSLKFRPADP